jgi:hypothetical protein
LRPTLEELVGYPNPTWLMSIDTISNSMIGRRSGPRG